MKDLFRLDWEAFDPQSGFKAAVAAIIIFGLTAITGESWLATGLVALFAWLANIPGTMKSRMSGLGAFTLGAIGITAVSGWMGLSLWPNTIAIVIVGFLGTVVLVLGTRAYMVGYVLICWAIYGPFLVDGSSVINCVLAILVGAGAIALTTMIGALFEDADAESGGASESEPDADLAAAIPYAITVALVLGLTTYLGWKILKTDPTMVVAGAFFVIGFDARKTWVAGVARVIGILGGIVMGTFVSQILPPGLITDAVAIAAFFLCFATGGINPALFMFFFLFIISLGWSSLDPEILERTFWERIGGEGLGVVIAMLAIGFLQKVQSRAGR